MTEYEIMCCRKDQLDKLCIELVEIAAGMENDHALLKDALISAWFAKCIENITSAKNILLDTQAELTILSVMAR